MKNVFIFLSGVTVGGIAAWKLTEKYYRDIADEEVKSVVETFKKRENENKNNTTGDPDGEHFHINDIEEANRILTDEYKNTEEEKTVKKTSKKTAKTEIISPEEYGELDGYSTKSFTYYNNDVLVDDFDTPIGNPEIIIGDALNHFGEYEDDSVYVRNTKFKTDYEILKSEKDFTS